MVIGSTRFSNSISAMRIGSWIDGLTRMSIGAPMEIWRARAPMTRDRSYLVIRLGPILGPLALALVLGVAAGFMVTSCLVFKLFARTRFSCLTWSAAFHTLSGDNIVDAQKHLRCLAC